MHRITRRLTLGALTAMLVAASAGAAPLAAPEHVERARDALVTQRAEFGLGAADDFRARTSHVNDEGTSIVRFVQEHLGVRVWGAEAIAHVHADGGLKTVTSGIAHTVTPAGTPRLTGEQAVRIALRELAPKGNLAMAPRAEAIVFPSRYTGGLVMVWDRVQHRSHVDRARSVVARPPAAPYVWAWEVHTVLLNRLDGHRESSFIVDANSGAILRKDSDLHAAAAPPATTAAVGTGHGFYNPDVKLGTTHHTADKTFSLVDTTRGAIPNAFLAGDAVNFYSYTGPALGLVTMYEDHQNGGFAVYQGNAVDTWGDGQAFAGSFVGDWHNGVYSFAETTVNGQTPAVDAQFSMATTWDFYKHVFGRNGIDNKATSAFSYSHELDGLTGGPLDAAAWSDSLFGMFYGDGSYPSNPTGFQELAAMDVTGHEMTHGVTTTTAALLYSGESGALSESISDIFGEMVEAYAKRAAGADKVIPEGCDFLVGAGPTRGTPLRYFSKPSKDGLSEDQWYDGIALQDAHYGGGPLDRAFYFLSQGASASSGDDAYSPYLPGGMTGIGNDRSGHIFYKALTEYFTPSTDYAGARTAVLQAAKDLYGQVEVDAVMSAFAAVNVGEAPGQAPRTHVTFPDVHATGYLSALNAVLPNFERAPIFPINTPVALHADVTNNADTTVQWLLQGRPAFNTCGGTINANGTWTTSSADYGYRSDSCWITAVSNADPLEFAVGTALLVNIDADDDLQQDAIDLGSMALSWGLTTAISPSHSVLEAGLVSDFDAAAAVEAIRNAFPVR